MIILFVHKASIQKQLMVHSRLCFQSRLLGRRQYEESHTNQSTTMENT